MSPAAAPLRAAEPDLPFPSLTALRSAHNDLLKSQPDDDESAPSFVAGVEEFLQRGQETGTLLDTPEDRWSAQSALDYWATTLYRINRKDVDPILADFDPTLAPELEDDKCPYVGLEAFRESQKEIFFGRSRLIDEMIASLKANRLLAVLGPSGSGKSSVVLGGLLPALKDGILSGSENWLYLPPMVPGAEPLRSLARALRPAGVDPTAWVSAQMETFEQDPQHLARLVAERGGEPAVLVIDQFEEVFTLCEDSRASRQQAFVANLLGLLRTPAPRHLVILTVRSDYETHVARLGELQPFFENGQTRVSALNAAELREAIERPAERVGLKFENGLVDALLDDILGEPAGLPLLQFTLLKLWEKRDRNRVTLKTYAELGGGHSTLANSADEFYNGLIPEEQVTVRRILLRMVQPRDLEITSRRIPKESLDKIGEASDRIDRVLGKLVAARLVRLTPGETPADTQIEIAHEALIRNWGRLVDWLNEAREAINTLRRLKNSAEAWVYLGRGQGGLLDEVQLLEAERWLKSPQAADLGFDEHLVDLVRESRKAVDQAARSQRRSTLLRWGALAAVVLSLVSWLVLAWWINKIELEEKREEVARLTTDRRALEKDIGELRNQRIAERTAFNAERSDLDKKKDQANRDKAEAERQIEQAKRAKALADAAMRNADLETQAAKAARSDADRQEAFANIVLDFSNTQLEQAGVRQKEAVDQLGAIQNEIVATRKEFDSTRDQLDKIEERLETELADGGKTRPETLKGQIRDTVTVISDRWDLRRFRRNYRPVRPGTSISTSLKNALLGTICCIVEDSSGRRYLLSRASVFAGDPGTPVFQPSPQEFGDMMKEQNVVAYVERAGKNENRSGAIARLADNVSATSKIPRLGYMEGIADNVEPEIEVRLVGRGGGIQKGHVQRIEADGTIVTDITPAPGDSGGPLLTVDRKLIGMLWGWSARARESHFMPIGQILKELDVTLVVKKPAPEPQK